MVETPLGRNMKAGVSDTLWAWETDGTCLLSCPVAVLFHRLRKVKQCCLGETLLASVCIQGFILPLRRFRTDIDGRYLHNTQQTITKDEHPCL